MPRQAKARAMLSAVLAAGLGMAQVAELRAGAAVNPTPPVNPTTPVDPTTMAVPDTLEAHIQAATQAAGLDLWGILTLCLPADPSGTPAPADMVAPPTKVFDNLYYVGMKSVAAWALTTS